MQRENDIPPPIGKQYSNKMCALTLSLSGQPHQQINRRGRVWMNAYKSSTSSLVGLRPRVHTSVTFSGRRDGSMQVKRRNITGTDPSTSSLSLSTQCAPSEAENMLYFTGDDDPTPMDDLQDHDETLLHKRKRTAAVRPFAPGPFCLLTGA